MKPWQQIVLLAVGLFVAHYAYKFGATHEARAWGQYRGLGIEGAILWAFVLVRARAWSGALGWIAALICCWGIFQHVEMFACSFGGPVATPYGKGICTGRYGPWPNIILAAAGWAAFLLWRFADEQTFGRSMRGLGVRIAAIARSLGNAGRAIRIWMRGVVGRNLKN